MVGGIAQAHWNYFLLLEEDLNEVFKYIEPEEDNLKVYGTFLVKLFLSIGSEIDAIMKELVECIDSGNNKLRKHTFNIDGFRSFVQSKLQDEFYGVEVSYSRYELSSIPWDSWWESKDNVPVPTESNPQWWKDYNSVKHKRTTNYKLANLGNILDAIAALFTIITSLHRHTEESEFLDPVPKFTRFANDRYGSTYLPSEINYKGELLTFDHLVFNTKIES